MSDSDALRSVFKDPLDLEMDDLAKPNPILRLKWSIQSLQSTRREAVPHHGTSHWSSAYSDGYPLWFPSFLHLHPIILPSLPLFQLTHYSFHIYDPKDHITWERTLQKSEGNTLYQVEDWDDIYYWITCCMEHHWSQIFNSSWLRSCDRS